ncbi:hypothetical protein [Pseudonocardia sp. TRM90224]|uniref:hypothetical protein n=1 Tax=Pseudonocardia sp. TRM90224 TaxID=2812678 RepID=UPI001E3A9822|nr:hypothetical protein [Pseudonocardia sp. TRM90224]
MNDADEARRWLDARGVTAKGTSWWELLPSGESVERTANHVAHEWTSPLLNDTGLEPRRRLQLALGLIDLLGEYAVSMYIRLDLAGSAEPELMQALWAGYRTRLEREASADVVTYSLWVDWFEDRSTSAIAFSELLGNDAGALGASTEAPLLRRADRVLRHSGPVLWPAKHSTYEAALGARRLHSALLQGLWGSQWDVYGDIDRPGAIDLLARLELSGDDAARAAQLRSTLD